MEPKQNTEIASLLQTLCFLQSEIKVGIKGSTGRKDSCTFQTYKLMILNP